MEKDHSDPPPAKRLKPISRLIVWCLSNARWLTWVLFLAAIVTFAALPLFGREIFFDENALLIGGVLPTYKYAHHY